MLFSQSSPLLTKQNIEVSAKGDLVTLRIGNTDISMGYEEALRLSAMVRSQAAEIKRMTGRGRTLRALGIIHDAEAKLRPMSVQRGIAIHIKQPLQRFSPQTVAAEGRLVVIAIGHSTIKLHFESALKVSQWLRVRAKEAKRRAGDMSRHWSAVAVLEDLK